MRGLLAAAMIVMAAGTMRAEDPIVAKPLVPVARSISASQQFVVYFQDKAVRARLARKVEDIKDQWLRRLSLTDEWKAPIIVKLNTVRPARSARVSTQVFESDDGEMKIQVDIFEPTVIQSAEFDIEIYRALCLEYAYRKSPLKAGKPFSQPPSWLLEGLYEDNMSRESGLASSLYAGLIDRGNPPKLESFLKIRPWTLDATSRAIYRAQALGLLRGFLALPGGASSLAEYLARLPDIEAVDAKPLTDSFPALAAEPGKLSKMWVLSMADASASGRLEPLDSLETRKQLAAILDMTAPPDPKDPKKPPVRGPSAITEIARSKEGKYVLSQKAEDLMRLEIRAHPMIRPMVEEYRAIVTELVAKPKKKLDDRIAKNTALITAVTGRANEVADYMNWYEAARLEMPSGEFTNINGEPPVTNNPRSDEISRHIDDLEVRGW